MTEEGIAAYVDAACEAQGIALDPAERERVLLQFARLAAIAAPLMEISLPPEVELASVLPP